jgi:signal transduction histidine kinase
MRAQFVRAAVTATAVALVLFAVPLAGTARALIVAQARADLQQAALQAAVFVGPTFGSGDPIELPAPGDGVSLGVYGPDLYRRAGDGPVTADPVTASITPTGQPADGQLDGALVVAVPVTADEQVVGAVRAATPESVVWRRVLFAWSGLAALAGLCLAAAVLVARRRGRTLAAPLEQLAATAERVGAGDLTARATVKGGAEIERVARTQNAMLDQLTAAIERERRFSAAASHQLRTPLMGLQLGLEAALHAASTSPPTDVGPRVQEALDLATELDSRVAHLLQLARTGTIRHAASAPVKEVISRAQATWHSAFAEHGRRLVTDVPAEVGSVTVPALPVTEVLDVLLHNALRHGAGQTGMTVRDLGSALRIDVSDEGAVTVEPSALFERTTAAQPDDSDATGETSRGIGLPLARTLAHAYGGRLMLTAASPTRFSLLLPRSETASKSAPRPAATPVD